MEKWQRNHIRQNIRQLVDYTSGSCDITFLSAFQEENFLTTEEITSITIIPNPNQKCWNFYELIQKKTKSYEPLKTILRNAGLTGALEILNQVNSKNSNTPFKNFGTISYDMNKYIGRGSHSTSVYEGIFEKRDVAVKIFDAKGRWSDIIASKEIDILTNLDCHPNVVRYFKSEFTEEFILVAIELYKMDLNVFVRTHELCDADIFEILTQISGGLKFIHSKHIVHLDLKPGNILIVRNEAVKLSAKLSNFGISQRLQDRMSRIAVPNIGGTPGWMAPEVIRQLPDDDELNPTGIVYVNQAADIFSLGCTFYFVLTGGLHPFGNKTVIRQANILTGDSELDSGRIKIMDKLRTEALLWLINLMIKDNEKERPNADTISNHPALMQQQSLRKNLSIYNPSRLFTKDTILLVLIRLCSILLILLQYQFVHM